MTVTIARPSQTGIRTAELRRRPLSYSEFTLADLEREFGIVPRGAPLFPEAPPATPPGWLADTLSRGRQLPLVSEKARSELLVMPLLLAFRELSGESVSIYSGIRLDVDAERGLIGECDFILAPTPPLPELRAPIMTIVEAKRGEIELGFSQCAAQMVGAMEFNERANSPAKTVFGCITSGEAWQFLRLENGILTLDPDRHYIDDPSRILGVLMKIVEQHRGVPS